MRDLKHLIYFEDLLQEANNDLVKQAKDDGKLALGYTCYFMPEVLLDLPGCFSVRLRAPRCTSPDMATYYMSSRTCHYGRSLLERALEGGFNFLDAQMATETCTVTCRFQEHLMQKHLDSVKDMDIIQNSKITTSNMWLDEGDATGALYGMYHQFRATFQTAMIYWGDYRAGTFTNGAGGSGSADKMFNNALDSSETKGTNWGSSYTTINNANLILRHVPGIAFSDENQKNLILANAHFVRAYTYYNIARVWGDAPLLLEGFESSDNDLQPSRSDAALIYEQVARDIDDALRLMPASAADCTIATRSAVQMLKADYNLWLYQTREGGDDALTAADEALAEVFKDSRLDLIGSYADIFDITKKNNAEIILTLHFGQGEYEGGYAETYLIPQTRFHSASEHIETHVKLMTANDQRFIFSPSLVELLYKDERDTRTPVSYGDWTDEEEGYRYTWVNKFAGKWADNKRYFISDLPLYRYAEALLFKAEIENERGNVPTALAYLNRVAKRAYGIDNYYTASDYHSFKESLMTEYLKEFAGEGKSWWNYIRLGYAFTKIESLRGRQNETNILLWPITTACMNENPNIRQTVGYN